MRTKLLTHRVLNWLVMQLVGCFIWKKWGEVEVKDFPNRCIDLLTRSTL